MNKTIPFAFSAALVLAAAPLAAQYGGSINRDAPTASSSLEFKSGAKLHVKYVSIHFGEGKWQQIKDNTAGHERFNKRAANKPIGSIRTNAKITASGREVPAGNYDLFFTVHEQAGWILNLKKKNDAEAKPIRWRMVMSDAKSHPRFRMALEAGAEANTASITVAFGAKSVTVPLKVGAVSKDHGHDHEHKGEHKGAGKEHAGAGRKEAARPRKVRTPR